MYIADVNILYSCTILHIMRKKNPRHPRLYTDISINGKNINLSFLDNAFNNDGSRLILKEVVHTEEKLISLNKYLHNKNKLEYDKLIKYIQIQKKVLDKHQKSGNYDSFRIIESSILLMEEFKDSFENWFKN